MCQTARQPDSGTANSQIANCQTARLRLPHQADGRVLSPPSVTFLALPGLTLPSPPLPYRRPTATEGDRRLLVFPRPLLQLASLPLACPSDLHLIRPPQWRAIAKKGRQEMRCARTSFHCHYHCHSHCHYHCRCHCQPVWLHCTAPPNFTQASLLGLLLSFLPFLPFLPRPSPSSSSSSSSLSRAKQLAAELP
jgi:hypothetical protein